MTKYLYNYSNIFFGVAKYMYAYILCPFYNGNKICEAVAFAPASPTPA